MPQDPHHLPRGAVSVCFGAGTGISEKYEAEKGEFTDLPVCRNHGAYAGGSKGASEAD